MAKFEGMGRSMDFVIFGKEGFVPYARTKNMVSIKGNIHISMDTIMDTGMGGRFKTPTNKEYFIVRPTVHAMISTLKRGAQIIKTKDIGAILTHLPIFPGSNVIECGVGSGALTIALLHYTSPNGRVISIERDRRWMELAKQNISFMADAARWHLYVGDIYEDSITPKDLGLKDQADAFILDLPEPWRAIENVDCLLADGGGLAIYVPTFNQIKTTIEHLATRKNYAIESVVSIMENRLEWFLRDDECILRPEINGAKHTAYILFAIKLNKS